MRIKISKNSIEAAACASYFSQALGLMFAHKPKPMLLIFKRQAIYSLHMLFVFFPIDVIFMDKGKKVVELKENFNPFTFYAPKNKAKYILELPKGSIKRYKIKAGQRAIFK